MGWDVEGIESKSKLYGRDARQCWHVPLIRRQSKTSKDASCL